MAEGSQRRPVQRPSLSLVGLAAAAPTKCGIFAPGGGGVIARKSADVAPFSRRIASPLPSGSGPFLSMSIVQVVGGLGELLRLRTAAACTVDGACWGGAG